jgi:hypothetical protein
VGVYRFWRDGGLVVGALLVGLAADRFGSSAAIAAVAALTTASGLGFYLMTAQNPRVDERSGSWQLT